MNKRRLLTFETKIIQFSLETMVRETIDSQSSSPRNKLGDIYEIVADEWVFVCARCADKFPAFPQFSAHIQVHLADDYADMQQSCMDDTEIDRVDHTEYDAHPSIEYASVDDDIVSESSDSDEANVIDNRTYECYICHISFTKRCHCHYHLKEHSGFDDQCEYCMEKFVLRGYARKHRNKCGPMNQYKCQLCPLKFYNKQARKRHNRTCPAKMYRSEHANHDTFACQRCSVTFIDQLQYARHMKVHEIPLYRCDKCTYDTFVASNMTKHTSCNRTCHICSRMLSSKHTLATHMLTHQDTKNYQCATCGKQFSARNGLAKHMLTHTGVRKHKCDLCPLAFTRSDKLTRHRRLHANDHLRTCRFCSKFFRVKQALVRHTLKVHGMAWDAEIEPDIVAGTETESKTNE